MKRWISRLEAASQDSIFSFMVWKTQDTRKTQCHTIDFTRTSSSPREAFGSKGESLVSLLHLKHFRKSEVLGVLNLFGLSKNFTTR